MKQTKISEIKKHVIAALERLEKEQKEFNGYALIVMGNGMSGITGEFEPLNLLKSILSFLARIDVINPEVALGLFQMVEGFVTVKQNIETLTKRRKVN